MYTITFGGWYQRTTLHLSEIYDFLALGRTKLNLSFNKLQKFRRDLNLLKVTREVGYLEYVEAKTQDDISIRYYEDGLYVLETTAAQPANAIKKISDYFDQFFNPAISYIFSLGAPIPKVLADIKVAHPIVVSTDSLKKQPDPKLYGETYSQIKTSDFTVYKTPQYIFVAAANPEVLTHLIEMQIFFREFKDQLERYLQIHREVWEEIASYKEQNSVFGRDLDDIRLKLDNYQKTITLISSRLNQMSVYLHTRGSIARKLKIKKPLLSLFQYKFETLIDTHLYIKEIWKMTADYLHNAIKVIVETKNQSTNQSLQSLTLITTVGVISGIVGYLSKTEFPQVTPVGIWYYSILILLTWLVNEIIRIFARNRRYRLSKLLG